MGYTSKTWDVLRPHLVNGISVLDFGAQNDYMIPENEWIDNGPPRGRRPQYVSERYRQMGIEYSCIDLNKENNALDMDLSEPIDLGRQFDIVVDAGTKEHIHRLLGAFQNQFNLCKVGGLIYCENPRTGSWPGHGFHYFNYQFYVELSEMTGARLLMIEGNPAMGNTKDGWNVIALMIKTKEVTLNQLPHVFTE